MTRSLLHRLDDVAHLTGIPQFSGKLARQQQRRRHLRWWPIVALTIATVGLGLSLVSYSIGMVLLVLPQGWAGFIAMFGPVKPWGTLEGVDERDVEVRRNAYLFGLAVTSLFMLSGMGVLVVVAVVERWAAGTLVQGFAALWLYDLLLLAVLPTLHASWATQPIEDE
jgi:hypothetical protein